MPRCKADKTDVGIHLELIYQVFTSVQLFCRPQSSPSCPDILHLWTALYASKKIQRDVVAPVALFDLSYFLLGQSLAGQLSQFSLSSFSNPKGIISPHWQAHPRAVDSSRRLSQKGQHNIGPPH